MRSLILSLLLFFPTQAIAGDIYVASGAHTFDIRWNLEGFEKLNWSVSRRYVEWSPGGVFEDQVSRYDTDGDKDNFVYLNHERFGEGWDNTKYVVPPPGHKNGCIYWVALPFDEDGHVYGQFGTTQPDWAAHTTVGASFTTGSMTLYTARCFNDDTNRAFWIGDAPVENGSSYVQPLTIADFLINGIGINGHITVGASYAPTGVTPNKNEEIFHWDDISYIFPVALTTQHLTHGRVNITTETSKNPNGTNAHPDLDFTIDTPTPSGSVQVAMNLAASIRLKNPDFNAWDTRAFLRMAADRYATGWTALPDYNYGQNPVDYDIRAGYGLLHKDGTLNDQSPLYDPQSTTSYLDIADFDPNHLDIQSPIASPTHYILPEKSPTVGNLILFAYTHFQQTNWASSVLVRFEEDPSNYYNQVPDDTFWGLAHTVLMENADPTPGYKSYWEHPCVPEEQYYWYAFFSKDIQGNYSRMVAPSVRPLLFSPGGVGCNQTQ